jgi:ABC-2 type transport system ATP-binding protein
MSSLAHAPVLSAHQLTKRFRDHVALADVTFDLEPGHVVGLLGLNGAGKSTLLHTIAGLTVPTTGACHTFGRRADQLEAAELERLGLVMQEGRFIEWMTVRQHLDYTASFYGRWDRDLEERLIALLDVPAKRKLADLSPGDRQKVSILLGVCHRPSLLLLDEPMSSLDPVARASMLDFLIERLREDGCSIVISSHLLADVEKIVDWVVVLAEGRLAENRAFDELQESFAEWVVTAREDRLLPEFEEPCFLQRKLSGRVARLLVRSTPADLEQRYSAEHGVTIQTRPLSLEEMFPLLVGKAGAP